MSVLGVIALLTGVAGVWLTIKESIWCWPTAIISVIASMIEFFKQNLLGDLGLQFLYLITAIYGWYFWNKNKTKIFKVEKIPLNLILTLVIATVAQTFLFYYLIIFLKGDKALFDAILTACSLTTTYMMTKKWLENWLAWIVIDIAYVFLYGLKFMWLFAVLYLFFAIMAFYGWMKWKRIILSK